jgi:hypothetical protein
MGSDIRSLQRELSAALLTVALIACAGSRSKVSPIGTVPELLTFRVVGAECYRLSYSDAVRTASARLFPTWFALLPGADSGSVAARHHPQFDDQSWAGVSKYARWKRFTPDSLEVMFSGSYEAISIHVARIGPHLIGRATWLSDVIGPDPKPSMHVIGNREDCPQNVSPAA